MVAYAVEASLSGSVRVLPSTERQLDGWAYVLEPSGSAKQLDGDVAVDLSVVSVAFPRTGARTQIADLEVWISPALYGYPTPADQFGPLVKLDTLPEISIDMALGQPTTWSFAVPYRKRDPLVPTISTRPLPSPVETLGKPTGIDRVYIYGSYLTDAGRVTVPLMSEGVATDAHLEERDGGAALVISGGDAWTQGGNRVEAGFSLPPGHGIPRGTVIQMIAEHGHNISTSLWSGTPMYRDVQIVGEEFWPRMAELADADNRLLFIDADANLTAQLEVDKSSPVVAVIGPRDVVAGSVAVDGPGSYPTRIYLSGQQQVLRDQNGHRTVETIATAKAQYAVKTAALSQSSGGALSSTGTSTGAPELQKFSETKSRITYDAATPVVEEIEVKGWYNPQAWRYQFVADEDGVDGIGDYGAYNGSAYLYDSGAVKNDSAPAYQWNRERYGVIGRQTSTHSYDSRGYLVGTEAVKQGYVFVQQAIKTRSSKAVTFEITNHSAVKILGNGVAAGNGETFKGAHSGSNDKIERSRLVYSVTDAGYIDQVISTREAWDSAEGDNSLYLYGDGSERARSAFAFIEVERVVEQYYAVSDRARKTTITSGIGGEILEVLDDPVDGWFPVAQQRTDIDPDPALYVGREDLLAQARAASRHESKPIRYDLISYALETRQWYWEERQEFALAEDVDDLRRRADALLSLRSALTDEWSMMANFLLRPGVRVHHSYPKLDIESDVHIVAVSHSRNGRDAPVLTRCAGRIYVA